MPFAWGTQDCCQFARKAVRAIRGKDPAWGMGLRRYKTARGALSNLHRLGGLESLPEHARLTEIPVRRAQRGDVVIGPVGERGEEALGIVIGAKAAFAGSNGLDFVPVLECRRAWRV